MTQEIVLPFIVRMRDNLSDDEEAEVFAMIQAGETRSIPELIWRINDLNIPQTSQPRSWHLKICSANFREWS